MAVLDMQLMRYINLLDKAAHVKTQKCFVHNNTIFFAVSRRDMSKAIGPAAANVRKIQDQLGRKVRVIEEANGITDAQRFIDDIISPVRVKTVEIKDGAIVITAGSSQNKAVLIGRNRRRFEELEKVIKDYFSLDLKVI